MNVLITKISKINGRDALLALGLLSALTIGFLIPKWELLGLIAALGFWLGILFVIFLYKRPDLGLNILLLYSFIVPFLGRELYPIQFGIGIEALMLMTFIVALLKSRKDDRANLSNDLMGLTLMWFIISVLQVLNPSGASIMGWVQEIRSAAVHGVLIVPIAFLIYNKQSNLNAFLIIVIGISVIASLNGARQLYYGLFPGEQVFLRDNAITHLLWGQLRVFSFYTDAGMFGASQAHIALITAVLVFGPFKTWVRLLLIAATGILLYGMLISGTRGALFVLVFGAFAAILLFKNYRILVLGLVCGALALGFLKYTHIGSGNYHIYRLRTALDPQDASLNLRFENQQILRNYMADKPFGGGLGVIGAWGHKYNSDKFLSKVEPDSYWVKVWAMYGIVGLTIWFCMILYIIGKCGGYIWKVKDPALRVKLIALAAGTVGVFVSSYGNEVINRVPTSLIVYISWVFIYLSPKWEKQTAS